MKFGAKSQPRAPRRITLSSYCWPPPPPFPSSFSFSLEPPTQPSPISTYLFTATSNLWSSLDSSSGMEAKPKCVSKFEYVYTKEEKKENRPERKKEREERRKGTVGTRGFHLLSYTWKILLERIQPLRMIRQLLPRWSRFAWIVQIVFPWFSSTRVNETKFSQQLVVIRKYERIFRAENDQPINSFPKVDRKCNEVYPRTKR